MAKKKHIRIVQYCVFVYEDDALDLEDQLGKFLNNSGSVLQYVCTGERWS